MGLLAAVPGCPAAARRQADPFDAALRGGDALWDARAAGGVDAAESAYAGMLVAWSEDGRVLARLARVEWSRGLIDPENATTHHAAGREYAMRCVLGVEGARDEVYSAGDVVTVALVTSMDASRAPCLVYAAAHTVGLVSLRGAGAALDLADVGPLLTRAAELDPTVEPALAAWSEGMSNALAPGGDPTVARSRLRAAIELAPGVAFYRASLERTFPDADGAWEDYRPDPAWALENRAVGAPPRATPEGP